MPASQGTPARIGPATRAAILSIVARDPGIHVTEIAEGIGRSWHTTSYHLAILEREGQLFIQRRGRNRCVFPKRVSAWQRPWLVAMRVSHAREILRALLDEPRQDIPTLARKVGCSAKVVRRRLEYLERVGVLERAGIWRPLFRVKRSQAHRIAALLPAAGAWEWESESVNGSTVPDKDSQVLGVVPEPGPTYQASDSVFAHPSDLPLPALSGAAGGPRSHAKLLRVPPGDRHARRRMADLLPLGRRGTPAPHKAGWLVAEAKGGKAAFGRRLAARLAAVAKAIVPDLRIPARRGIVGRPSSRVGRSAGP